MPRGRQYYDPIVQVPGTVEGAQDLSRIEMYPEGSPDDPNPKWRGRRIAADGSIAEVAPGDFDQERAIKQAEGLWPGLMVYVLREEGQDSTWEGHGPSPRLWQQAIENREDMSTGGRAVAFLPEPEVPPPVEGGAIGPPVAPAPVYSAVRDKSWEGSDSDYFAEQVEIHPLVVPEGGIRIDFQEGVYMPLDEIVTLLEAWAVSYEEAKNPSGAMALREAIEALKEIG